MPKLATIQTNFTGGELTPLLLGRVDIAKYNNGVARMENFKPIVQGGAVSRDGSRYLGIAKGASRLIPFVFSRTQAYQIEIGVYLGAGYLRIWRAVGTAVESSPSVPLEIATPYDDNATQILGYEQAEDTMFLFHTGFMPRRLQRLDDTTWRFEAAPFITPPLSEQGFSSAVGVTLSDASIGTGRTFTADSGVFLPGDVGRDFESGLGSATITGYTSATVVTGTINSTFASTAVTSWTLTDSPYAFLYARQKEPVGSTVAIDAAISRAAGVTLSAKTGAITITADAAVFVAGDTGKVFYADAGTVTVTFVDSTHLSGTTATDFLRTGYQTGAWGITGDAFRAGDVGSYLRLNSGLFLITSFASAAQVQAEIRVASSAIVAAPPGSWSMSTSAFGATPGYPRCGSLHEQRLWLAGTLAEPQGVWASRIAEYLDFEPGLLDADGFGYTLNMHQRNPIVHLISGKRLFPLTTGLELSLRGGNEKAIGPTNIQKETESRFGANDVRPVVIGKEVVFVQGAGRKVRALGYSPAADGYDSPDRTVFAEHITESGVTEMAYQPEPGSLLHCTRTDGLMAVAAYDVGQEVIAWARYITDGVYRSVSVVPTAISDDVWAIVARTDPLGATKYYIERFEPDLATDCASTILIDDGLGIGVTTISGLDRFEGFALAVKADGSNMGPLTVVGGVITLPREGFEIEAGLPFVPLLEMLPPEVGASGGTAQGSNVSVHEVAVRLLDTATLEINGEQSDFRQFGEALLDQPPPGFTGDYRVITLTDDFIRDTLVIRQPLPFKTHVQAVIRKLTVNDV